MKRIIYKFKCVFNFLTQPNSQGVITFKLFKSHLPRLITQQSASPRFLY